MKAMVLTGIREMEMRDIPDPEITTDKDVLLRIAAVGVCGSDVHYYTTGRIGDQVVEYPYAVGHETSAIVERIGAGVTRVKPGDRVAIDPAISCWKCDQCLAGRPNTCRELLFLGCPGQVAGCLSEFIVMPEESCYPLSENITMDQATIAEPLSIGVYAVKQSVPMPNATVGILGSGPIGLSVLLAARQSGAAKVYVTDKIDDRLRIAESAGATLTANPDKEDIEASILAAEPAQLDVVFECCGQQEALDQALHLLKPGGKLMVVGIPTTERISFNAHELRRGEVDIYNVRRQADCVQPALDLIDSGKIDVDFMLTHRFAFEDSKQAFDLVAAYGDGVIKAVIEMPGM